MNIWTQHLRKIATDETVAETVEDMVDAVEQRGDIVLNRTIETVRDYRDGDRLAIAVHVVWEAKR